MPTYKTPGVYVEEIATLPPSVAEVSTAVPAFIGYTERGPEVARINTLLEYEELFGGPQPRGFAVATNTEDAITSVTRQGADSAVFLMYYCLRHYFLNGGGSCWVFKVGDYSATPGSAHFLTGLSNLEREDEPTLIVLTDAVRLDATDYHTVCAAALQQCGKLGDRFAILDIQDGDVAGFRNASLGTDDLKYGAAYHPYLETSIAYTYDESGVTVTSPPAAGPSVWQTAHGGVTVRFEGAESDSPRTRIVQGDGAAAMAFEIADGDLTIRNVNTRSGTDVAAAWTVFAGGAETAGWDVVATGDGSAPVPHTSNTSQDLDPVPSEPSSLSLASLKSSQTALYTAAKSALGKERITLPPSAAVAGIYASVDRSRGVWKAPANVAVLGVSAPTAKITQNEQENLNVDPSGAGKSINAIRAFTGRGILVWGARTLAGDDNEWRYVPVRRLFNLIEESTRKSTSFAVFEPNDATTWLKVKGMIESYLYGLWEKGALAGSTPEAAYYVNVGLGVTMTSQDVLEGRMKVEIGVAAVRPAEFIILRFSHKLQEA